jgi:xylulose-5-phosphate/fructose-6-phosphate phosphoketolase
MPGINADMSFDLIDAYWRASNYLSVGQIYLLDNPLLKEPLKRAHIKPRLVGHWGTTPGLNFIYVHLNRVYVVRSIGTNRARQQESMSPSGLSSGHGLVM